MVVNQFVKGGWLEFLGLIESQVDKFDEQTALEETSTTAASEITSKAQEQKPEEHKERQQKQQQDSKQNADAEQDATKMKATKQAGKTVSSIWDTGANDFKTAIDNLRFDPRVSQASGTRWRDVYWGIFNIFWFLSAFLICNKYMLELLMVTSIVLLVFNFCRSYLDTLDVGPKYICWNGRTQSFELAWNQVYLKTADIRSWWWSPTWI